MKTKILKMTVIMVLALAAYAGAGQTEPVDKEKESAIKQYLKIVPVEEMFNETIADFTKKAPPEAREAIEETFKILNKQRISDAIIGGMRKHFTTKELKALNKFYASPEGRSAIRKVSAMQAELLPIIQEEVAIAVNKFMETAKKSLTTDKTDKTDEETEKPKNK